MIEFILALLAGVALCVAFPSVPDKIRAGLKKLAKGGDGGEGGGP